MKFKQILVLITIAIAISSCKRKQVAIEPEGKLAQFPAHCYNGLTDADETGIDCGGSCAACVVAMPTCTQTTNKLTLSSSSYTISNVTYGNLNSPDEYEFNGLFSAGSIHITIGGAAPDVSLTYSITQNSFVYPGEANATINSSFYGNMVATSGKVFVNQNNGKYFATVCGASFTPIGTSLNYPGIINITCP